MQSAFIPSEVPFCLIVTSSYYRDCSCIWWTWTCSSLAPQLRLWGAWQELHSHPECSGGGKSLGGVDSAWPGRSCPTFHTGVWASLPCFLRPCICGLFSPCVPLWHVSSVHASVMFLLSVRQWRFFRPCVCGTFPPSVCLWLFFPPCVCGVSSVRASVVFSPSVDLWRFLCESVACFLHPRWRPSLLSSHHLLIAPCVLSLCQACGVCHLCGRVLRDTQGHTLGEPQWWGHSHAAQPSVWGAWCPPSSSRSSLGADPSSAFSPRGTSWSKLSKSKVGNGCEMRSGFRCVWSFLFTCLLHIPQMIYFPAGITINYQPLLVQNSMKDIWGGHSLKNMLDFHSCDLHDKAVRTVTFFCYIIFIFRPLGGSYLVITYNCENNVMITESH